MIELTKNTIGIGVFGMKLKTKLPVLVPAIILAVLICAGIALYIILIFIPALKSCNFVLISFFIKEKLRKV